MSKPNLIIQQATIECNVREITETLQAAFNQQNQTLPFLQRVIKMLPELEGQITSDQSEQERRKVVEGILTKRYIEEERIIQKKVEEKRKLVEEKIMPAVEEMQKLFHLTYDTTQVINGYLGYFNPFPRDVMRKEYCIHYLTSDEIFVRASLHEINHMILFDKWKEMFGYQKVTEPSFPDPLWYLEELSIEPTLNIPQTRQIAPYEHKAYDSFYETIIDGKSLPVQIGEIYRDSTTIEEYLERAYTYIEQHI
ncbi:hypothetical protein [Anaerosporobacter faecicola]|uniref:hypothetical protein n=1 Tax=Anaerosporobacter faecicola TaxID=2718714 RepID=UPI00143A502F|nr:hypothetical protein [Anaerosporobacter faecicola]